MTYFSDQFKRYKEIKEKLYLIYEINTMFKDANAYFRQINGLSSKEKSDENKIKGKKGDFCYLDEFSIKGRLETHASVEDILLALELSRIDIKQRQNLAGSLFAYEAAGVIIHDPFA